MKKLLMLSFITFVILACTTSGFALPLNPGDTLHNNDGGLAAPYYTSGGVPAGNALFDTIISPFSLAFSGSVESNVYKRAGGLLT